MASFKTLLDSGETDLQMSASTTDVFHKSRFEELQEDRFPRSLSRTLYPILVALARNPADVLLAFNSHETSSYGDKCHWYEHHIFSVLQSLSTVKLPVENFTGVVWYSGKFFLSHIQHEVVVKAKPEFICFGVVSIGIKSSGNFIMVRFEDFVNVWLDCMLLHEKYTGVIVDDALVYRNRAELKMVGAANYVRMFPSKHQREEFPLLPDALAPTSTPTSASVPTPAPESSLEPSVPVLVESTTDASAVSNPREREVDTPKVNLNKYTTQRQSTTSITTSLHHAVEENHFEFVKEYLKEYPENINHSNTYVYNGKTPLHLAARFDRLTILRFLLKQPNIDVNATDNIGNTALHCAVENAEVFDPKEGLFKVPFTEKQRAEVTVARLIMGHRNNTSLTAKNRIYPYSRDRGVTAKELAKLTHKRHMEQAIDVMEYDERISGMLDVLHEKACEDQARERYGWDGGAPSYMMKESKEVDEPKSVPEAPNPAEKSVKFNDATEETSSNPRVVNDFYGWSEDDLRLLVKTGCSHLSRRTPLPVDFIRLVEFVREQMNSPNPPVSKDFVSWMLNIPPIRRMIENPRRN